MLSPMRLSSAFPSSQRKGLRIPYTRAVNVHWICIEWVENDLLRGRRICVLILYLCDVFLIKTCIFFIDLALSFPSIIIDRCFFNYAKPRPREAREWIFCSRAAMCVRAHVRRWNSLPSGDVDIVEENPKIPLKSQKIWGIIVLEIRHRERKSYYD